MQECESNGSQAPSGAAGGLYSRQRRATPLSLARSSLHSQRIDSTTHRHIYPDTSLECIQDSACALLKHPHHHHPYQRGQRAHKNELPRPKNPAPKNDTTTTTTSSQHPFELFGPIPTLPQAHGQVFLETVPDDDAVFADVAQFTKQRGIVLSPPLSPTLLADDIFEESNGDFVLFP